MLQTNHNIFQHFIFLYTPSVEILQKAAILFFWVSVILIIIIYSNTYIEKRYFLLKILIQKRMTKWLAEQITTTGTPATVIPKTIRKILNSKYGKKIITDELITLKKNLQGKEAANIIYLYIELGLKNDSIKKIYSKKWHIKAKGINELYTMDQRDLLKVIYKNSNNKNELVRTEAQTGLVHMYGFDGLRFLNVISNPISEWQQIKLLAELQNQQPDNVFYQKIKNWIQSKNDSVVIFSLKIAATKHIHQVIPIIVQNCLYHNNSMIRKTAIESLIFFPEHINTLSLRKIYPTEIIQNKLSILSVLQKLGGQQDINFLKEIILKEEIDIAKAAMITLLKIAPEMINWKEHLLIQKNKVTQYTLHALDEIAFQ